jgi:hypothetical protein
MLQQILQINFLFNVTPSEYEKACVLVTDHFADLPSLQWKIWLMNENKKEAGGIYLFENADAVARYRRSELMKALESDPIITHISVKQFSILEKPGLMIHAPVNTQISSLN